VIAAPPNNTDLAKHVRRALTSLYDPPALRANPLSGLLAHDGGALRDCLLEAIDSLKPASQVHSNGRVGRPYRLLQLRYVEGLERAEVEGRLAISTSQFYRELESALEALVALVRMRLFPSVGSNVDVGAVRQKRHNLPAPVTSFVGRRGELAEIKVSLARTRLLTLTGTGGCGKTRLALETAATLVDDYEDGVWLVDLTPLTEPGLVPQTVAFALGIHEAPGEAILTTLVRLISSRQLLVLLDNCEHLVQACAQLADLLLRSCANLRVMITSREILGIAGEKVWQVPPLAVSRSSDVSAECDAVQLFADRAASIVPGFNITSTNLGVVTQICARLDGLPLAIELAAARVKVLVPEQIVRRLDDRFRILTTGGRTAPPHHQTLEALIDWSYELLGDSEKQVFQSLSVFAGGWTVEAAEFVSGRDAIKSTDVLGLLGALVDKSLVIAEPFPSGMRYRLLETLRQYAAARLRESGIAAEIDARHASYYTDLARRLETKLYGREQIDALRQLELEHNNFRTVLSNASASGTAAHNAAQVAASISLFWFLGNFFSEARHWLDWVLSIEVVRGTPAAARCLMVDGFLAASLGDDIAGIGMCDQAVMEAQVLGDAFVLAWALFGQAATNFIRGNAISMEKAARQGVQASADTSWGWGVAICSAYLGRSLLMQRRVQEAADQSRTALDKSRAVGDPFTGALSLSFYAAALGAQGDYDTASTCLAQSLDLFRQLGSFAQQSRLLVDWAALALRYGHVDDAASALADGLTAARRLGHVPYRFAQLFATAAQLALLTQRFDDAVRLVAAAHTLRAQSGTQLPPEWEEDEMVLLARLRDQLGTTELDRLLVAGRMLDRDQAVAVAEALLDDLRDGASGSVPPQSRTSAAPPGL
jgi:non-specific serine/threonine protein kinase